MTEKKESFEPGSTKRSRHREKMVQKQLTATQTKIDNLSEKIWLDDDNTCPEVYELLKEHGYRPERYGSKIYVFDLKHSDRLEKSDASSSERVLSDEALDCACCCCLSWTCCLSFVCWSYKTAKVLAHL